MALTLTRETPEPAADGPRQDAPPALARLRSLLPQGLHGRIRSAGEMVRARQEEAEREERLPTAVPALDRLLEGGRPKGQLVEMIGSRSSGRFSTELAVLAAATSVGEAAALVDLGDGLDPATAEALGVDLERLLWVRPATLKQALAAAEMLLGSGFPLVVLDLGMPPVRGGRGVEAVWLRLARAAQTHGSALLIGTPYRVTGTAAAVVLKAGRARPAWQGGDASPWLLGGLASRIEIEKHRGRLPGQSEGLELAAIDSPLPARPAPAPLRRPRPVPAWEEAESLRRLATA